MTSSSDRYMQDLLSDAKLVADYGVRACRFGQDEGLFEAIRKASEKGDALTWSSDEAIVLQKALCKALQTTYPVTLHDLKCSWDNDANYEQNRSEKIRMWARNVFVKGVPLVATAVIVFLCASLTVWQQRASGLVSELAVDKVGQQEKAFDELLVLLGSDKLDELRNPASPLRETFREKRREIQNIQRSMSADYQTLERLNGFGSPLEYSVGWVSQAAAWMFTGDGQISRGSALGCERRRRQRRSLDGEDGRGHPGGDFRPDRSRLFPLRRRRACSMRRGTGSTAIGSTPNTIWTRTMRSSRARTSRIPCGRCGCS